MSGASSAAAFGADLSRFSVRPRIGSTVSFWCPVNDEPVRIEATVTGYYMRRDRRVFTLVHQGRPFPAVFSVSGDKMTVAPVDERGNTPASYPCDIKAPAR